MQEMVYYTEIFYIIKEIKAMPTSKDIFDAVTGNNPDDINECIRNGVSVNCRDDSGNTPLIDALKNHKIPAVNALLAWNPDLGARNKEYESAMNIIEDYYGDDYDNPREIMWNHLNELTSQGKITSDQQTLYTQSPDELSDRQKLDASSKKNSDISAINEDNRGIRTSFEQRDISARFRDMLRQTDAQNYGSYSR